MANDNLRILLPPGVIECIAKNDVLCHRTVSALIAKKFAIPTELINGLHDFSLQDLYEKCIGWEYAVPEALINRVAKTPRMCISIIEYLNSRKLTPPKKLFNGVWDSNEPYEIDKLATLCVEKGICLVPGTALQKLFVFHDRYVWNNFMYNIKEKRYSWSSNEHKYYSSIIRSLVSDFPDSAKERDTIY